MLIICNLFCASSPSYIAEVQGALVHNSRPTLFVQKSHWAQNRWSQLIKIPIYQNGNFDKLSGSLITDTDSDSHTFCFFCSSLLWSCYGDFYVFIISFRCYRLPDSFTQLKNLQILSLNDISLLRLPADIGRSALQLPPLICVYLVLDNCSRLPLFGTVP